MPVYLALLRAVNVGGAGRLAMSDLRDFFAAQGFAGAQTLLQTGNVVFRSVAPAGTELEQHLRREAKLRLGLDTDFLIRSAEEWAGVIAANPFPHEARHDPGHLLVTALPSAPEPQSIAVLQSAIRDREQVQAHGRHLYITYPDGIGRSRLTAALVTAKIGMSGTSRNWNTVLKLAALAARQP